MYSDGKFFSDKRTTQYKDAHFLGTVTFTINIFVKYVTNKKMVKQGKNKNKMFIYS